MKWIFIFFTASTASALPYGRGNLDQRCFKHGSVISPSLRNIYKVGEDVRDTPLVLPNGTIVLGSIDSNIYFLNPDGSLKTKFKTGAGVQSSPALTKEGLIAVGSGDGGVYFLTQEGEFKSKFQAKGSVFSSPTVTRDGTIVVGTTEGIVYFLTPDGKSKGEYHGKTPIFISAVELKDGNVVLGNQGGDVFALNTSGKLLTTTKVGGHVAEPALGKDGKVLIGSADGKLNLLTMLPKPTRKSVPIITQKDGQLSVEHPEPKNKQAFATDTANFSQPLILENGEIVVGSQNHKVNFLKADGTMIRTATTSGRYPGTPAALKHGGGVVTGANDDIVYFFKKDGTEIKKFGPLGKLEDNQAYMAPPTVMNDGVVIITSNDGNVYFFTTDPKVKPCKN